MNLLTKEGWGYPLYDKLSQLKVPLRIIYGERDYVRPDFAPHIVSKVSNFDYIVIPKAGHHMYWSHPSSFSKAILAQHSLLKN